MPISIEATTNTSILGETLPTCSPSPVYQVETSSVSETNGSKDRVSAEKIYGNWYVVVNPDGTETYIQSDQASLVTEANCDDEKNTMDVSGGREQRESLDGNAEWFEVFNESDLANLTSEGSLLPPTVRAEVQNLLSSSNNLREQLQRDAAFTNIELSIYMYAIDTLDGTGDVILSTVVVSGGGSDMHFMAETKNGMQIVTLNARDGQIAAFLPDTNRNLIPAVFDGSGEVPLSLLVADENGVIEQSIDSTSLVDSDRIQNVFRLSDVLIISQDEEGDLFLDSSLKGTESIPDEESVGYSVKNSSEFITAAFDRGFGADDPEIQTRIFALPESIKNLVAEGVQNGEIKYDIVLESFVTRDGYLIRPDSIPESGEGYIHGTYTSEEAFEASRMVLGSVFEVNVGEGSVGFVFENPAMYGALAINPLSMNAVKEFVQRNLEEFSLYAGRTFIISMVADIESLSTRNGNVAINQRLGSVANVGYSYAQSGSTADGYIRINAWASVNEERTNNGANPFTSLLVAIASEMDVESSNFGRVSDQMTLNVGNNEEEINRLSCEMAVLGTETVSCEADALGLMRAATDFQPVVIPLVS
jgi:hypothetical protein